MAATHQFPWPPAPLPVHVDLDLDLPVPLPLQFANCICLNLKIIDQTNSKYIKLSHFVHVLFWNFALLPKNQL